MILINREKRLVSIRIPKRKIDIHIEPESESEEIDDRLKSILRPFIKAFNLQVKQSAEVTAPNKAEEESAAVAKEAADKEAAEKEAADKEAAEKEAAEKEAAEKEAAEKEAADKETDAKETESQPVRHRRRSTKNKG